MAEMIGQVALNESFYTGQDLYSDGNVEEKILDIVKNSRDFDKAVQEAEEFAVIYHLSREREFITEVMDISKSDTVLEIGSGCGAVTGALARKAEKVDCIELSKRRSLINAYKNQKCGNIEIMVGNYEDIVLTGKYDVITLIGVLEYARYYIHAERPFHNMLMDIKNRLNEGGRIYIAIENRLGAKYFAGCREDHTGKEFDGIEGYPFSRRAKTFSYYELIRLFQECGFSDYKFYYPYPDYKFPRQIFSDEYLPGEGTLFEPASDYSAVRNQYFDESKFLNSLVMEEEFKIFSNSFLICLRE